MNRSRAAVLLLAAGLALAPAARAADAFLKLEGIDGESKDDKHKGEIELDSFQLGGLRNSAEQASRSAGAGAGRVTFSPFSITKKVDKASPQLFKASASGKHFPTATISMRKAGGGQHEYLVVKLQDVLISSYRTSGGGAGQTETFVLNAANATLDYVPTPGRAALGAVEAAPAVVALAPTPVPPPKITGASAAAPFTGLAVTVTVASTGACRDAFVDYGDGSIAEGHTLTGTSTVLPAHTYASAGAKTIKVGGRDAPYWPPSPQKAPPQKGANPCTGWAPEVHVTLRTIVEKAPAVLPR